MAQHLIFNWYRFRLMWMYLDFRSENCRKPRVLSVNDKILDFVESYITKNGFLGEFNFEAVWDKYFKIAALRRSNKIKFARYE